MGEEPVSKRECDTVHDMLDKRLDSINDNFKTVFSKLDMIAGLNGKIEFANIKIDGIGKKLDTHVKEHGNFIKWSLLIISLVSILVAVVSRFLK